jgi:hypothetical protein
MRIRWRLILKKPLSHFNASLSDTFRAHPDELREEEKLAWNKGFLKVHLIIWRNWIYLWHKLEKGGWGDANQRLEGNIWEGRKRQFENWLAPVAVRGWMSGFFFSSLFFFFFSCYRKWFAVLTEPLLRRVSSQSESCFCCVQPKQLGVRSITGSYDF